MTKIHDVLIYVLAVYLCGRPFSTLPACFAALFRFLHPFWKAHLHFQSDCHVVAREMARNRPVASVDQGTFFFLTILA